MYKGQIMAVVDADDVSREQLGLMMAGSSLAEALAQALRPSTKEQGHRHLDQGRLAAIEEELLDVRSEPKPTTPR